MQLQFGMRTLLVDKSRNVCSTMSLSPPQVELQLTPNIRWMLNIKKKHRKRSYFSVCNVVCWEEHKKEGSQLFPQL